LDTYYNGAKIIIGAIGILLALIIGIIFSLGGEGTVLLMILMYVLGLSMGPRMVFDFVNPRLKIYLAAGPVGVAFVKLAIKIFTADGRMTEDEIGKLKRYLGKEFGKEIGVAAGLYINENQDIEESFYSICKPISEMKLAHRVTFLYQLFLLTATNGHFSEEEELALKKIGKFIHISKKRFYFIKSKVTGETADEDSFKGNTEENKKATSGQGYQFYQQFFKHAYDPFFVLGVEYTATNEEIKKMYRELVKKYHPDVSMNKSEQFRKGAVEKIQEINEAYDSIKKIRGIK